AAAQLNRRCSSTSLVVCCVNNTLQHGSFTPEIESPPMSGKRLNVNSIFYLIFFLSGATGLVYEVIWVRLTGLVFGNTSHAISTVLGAFMAGLALGSWKLGQKADHVE